jgi:hypothetical protein
MLQASEGIIVIMAIILAFAIFSRPPRPEKNKSEHETEVGKKYATDETANRVHDAGYSAASNTVRSNPDPYSPDQKVVIRVD